MVYKGLKDLDFQEYLSKQGSCLDTNMTIKEEHQYYYQIQQQLFATGKKYNGFVVCSIKENIEFVYQRVTSNQDHCGNVIPKLTNFWRFCVARNFRPLGTHRNVTST